MKIVVYDDNPDFGGHQAMAVHGVEALSADPSNTIIFLLNPKNRKLVAELSKIRSCLIQDSPCETRRPQGIRNRIDRKSVRRLEALLKSLHADCILCIQGDIEQSSQALIAAQQIGMECVSYLALPHSLETMGAKLGKLRDRANQYLWNLPSRYIVISESMATRLREHGTERPITVVPNGIAIPDSMLAPHVPLVTLGLLGRIEFNQKQQDFMVRTVCSFQQAFENCRLLIAGDGPDRSELSRLVARCSRSAEITLQPWQEDPEAFFSAIDLLVIPSRYEGVPLVMLEALARGIPVIGSNRDGMQDLLPQEWTFETGNGEALANTFFHVRENWEQTIGPLREKVLTEHALEAFKTSFVDAVLNRA